MKRFLSTVIGCALAALLGATLLAHAQISAILIGATTVVGGGAGDCIKITTSGAPVGSGPCSPAAITWTATQALTPVTGQQAFVTNYGTKGSLLQYDGARWKPVNGCAFIATLDTTSGNATNAAELTVLSYQFAAGMVQLKDRLRIGINQIKSGTTDTAMWKNYFGPLGTASDPLLFSANSLGAANLRDSIFVDFRVETATTVQQLGSGGGYSTASSAAIPPPVTVSSVTSNAMTWLTNIISNGGTNTTAAQDVFLQLCAPAN